MPTVQRSTPDPGPDGTDGPTTSNPTPPSERSLAASIAVNTSWANTKDRSARTAKARAARDQKFLDEAGGDPVRAEYLRKAHFQRLALKSAQARRKAKELTTAAEAVKSRVVV